MEVIICPDEAAAARTAASCIAHLLAGNKNPVLGVATGTSPLATYANLAAMVEAGRLDLSGGTAFALDEYVGLPPSHRQSYARTIERTVTVPLRMDPSRVHVPDGMAEDLLAACAAYDKAIADAGGVDVQVLGIGTNGHIGFNEPATSFASRTRVETLTRSTREDNARFFVDGEQVPMHCVTQGLGTIMDARNLVMVALGAHKADAVAATVEGPVSSMCPASIMQFHPSAIVVVDEPAAVGLRLADYYRHIDANRIPAQQFEH